MKRSSKRTFHHRCAYCGKEIIGSPKIKNHQWWCGECPGTFKNKEKRERVEVKKRTSEFANIIKNKDANKFCEFYQRNPNKVLRFCLGEIDAFDFVWVIEQIKDLDVEKIREDVAKKVIKLATYYDIASINTVEPFLSRLYGNVKTEEKLQKFLIERNIYWENVLTDVIKRIEEEKDRELFDILVNRPFPDSEIKRRFAESIKSAVRSLKLKEAFQLLKFALDNVGEYVPTEGEEIFIKTLYDALGKDELNRLKRKYRQKLYEIGIAPSDIVEKEGFNMPSTAEIKERIKEHTPLIGGCSGGLIGILFSLILQIYDPALVMLNTLVLGSIAGCAYGWVTAKIFSKGKNINIITDIKKGVGIGGITGAIFGLHPVSFGVFIFGYGFSLVYLLFAGFALDSLPTTNWHIMKETKGKPIGWIIYIVSGAIFGVVFSVILWGVGGFVGGIIVGAIPDINIVFGFILGSFLGTAIMKSIAIQYALFTPIFLIPLLAIVGYFVGKIVEEKEKYVEQMKSGYDKVVHEHSSLFRLSLTAVAIVIAIVIVLSSWSSMLSFISVVIPSLTYPNVMRIVVVGVVIYIIVSILRLLRKR